MVIRSPNNFNFTKGFWDLMKEKDYFICLFYDEGILLKSQVTEKLINFPVTLIPKIYCLRKIGDFLPIFFNS